MEIISGVSPFKNYYLNTRLHCHKSLNFPDNNLSQLFLDKDTSYTGWSISILYTLSGSYDNNNKCMKKIIVDIHSAYMEISSKIANLDIYKHLQSKI